MYLFFPDADIELRYQIVLCSRSIARFVDVDVLAGQLRAERILGDFKKHEIEQEHDFEEKAALLVLEVINERYENVLKFTKCLRDLNQVVADQIAVTTGYSYVGMYN
ncbi:hypothetical protein DPMN_075794 [Dreissena polymorpha]|uniref:Uncharacterized protein n=1 Tax=Dreissena polymorpha TaxID=45954 RepID=A0A9D3YHN0_DREPO|nr:hypothetical protein DPMN_075794 [Dreissena polymorpha]